MIVAQRNRIIREKTLCRYTVITVWKPHVSGVVLQMRINSIEAQSSKA